MEEKPKEIYENWRRWWWTWSVGSLSHLSPANKFFNSIKPTSTHSPLNNLCFFFSLRQNSKQVVCKIFREGKIWDDGYKWLCLICSNYEIEWAAITEQIFLEGIFVWTKHQINCFDFHRKCMVMTKLSLSLSLVTNWRKKRLARDINPLILVILVHTQLTIFRF